MIIKNVSHTILIVFVLGFITKNVSAIPIEEIESINNWTSFSRNSLNDDVGGGKPNSKKSVKSVGHSRPTMSVKNILNTIVRVAVFGGIIQNTGAETMEDIASIKNNMATFFHHVNPRSKGCGRVKDHNSLRKCFADVMQTMDHKVDFAKDMPGIPNLSSSQVGRSHIFRNKAPLDFATDLFTGKSLWDREKVETQGLKILTVGSGLGIADTYFLVKLAEFYQLEDWNFSPESKIKITLSDREEKHVDVLQALAGTLNGLYPQYFEISSSQLDLTNPIQFSSAFKPI